VASRIAGRFLLVLALVTAACNRNIEPFDPNEKVARPDLSKIFPEGAERTGDAQALRGEMPPAPEPAPPAAAGGAPLTGTIRISDELASRVPSGAVLFLIARTGGGGPPTAVRRIADPRFPLEFSIGPEDRMIQALPFDGPFELMARVDADRNAMTRNPGDLQGAAKGTFSPGAHDIEIVIDEVL
jgi:cytochrome c-type biogenesis protein CcmH